MLTGTVRVWTSQVNSLPICSCGNAEKGNISVIMLSFTQLRIETRKCQKKMLFSRK